MPVRELAPDEPVTPRVTQEDYDIDVKVGGEGGKIREIPADEKIDFVREAPALRKEALPARQGFMERIFSPKSFLTTAAESMFPPAARESPVTKGLVNLGVKSALPTAGAVVGGMVGGLPGEMAGSAIGTGINQAIGVEEPSMGQIGLSGAAPVVGRGIAKGVNPFIEWAVNKFAGRDIMSESAESLLRKWLSPATPSKDLYRRAEQQAANLLTPSNETARAVDTILSREVKQLPTEIRDEVLKAVGPLENFFQTPAVPAQTVQTGVVNAAGQPVTRIIPAVARGAPKQIEAEVMMESVARLRSLASRALDSENTALYQGFNRLRNAMLNDLERSGVADLRAAASAYRKEMALDDLGKMLGKYQPLQKIHDFMKDNPLFKGAFNPQEIAQIERIAKKMGSVSASGGHGVVGQIALGAFGLHEAGPWGMLLALAGPYAERKLLESPFARNFTERILAGSDVVTPEALAALAVFARGLMARTPQQVSNP